MGIGRCEYGSGPLHNDRRGPEKYQTTFAEDTIPYRELLERVPAVLYEDASDETSSTVYMSSQVEGMLGYAPNEWLNETNLWVNALHPKDRERVLAEHERTREAGEPFVMEYRLLRRDGRTVWLLDEATPVLGDDGTPTRWQGVMLDITERKESEEAIRKSEERFRLVARATGEALWDNDLSTGKQEWDGATEALFGYAPHVSDKGEWWEDRIHPEDRERVLSSLHTTLGGDGEAWTAEYRFHGADGTYAVVLDRGYIVRDEEGLPCRMVGSMADVTERREWERKLRETEARFRMTFEEAGVGMAHLSLDGKWLRVNDKLCEISGYGREELLGTGYLDTTLPEDVKAGQERVRRMLEGETGSYHVERRYVRKDGRRVWVGVSVSLVRKSSGEADYLVCVVEDITERKLRQLVAVPLTEKELEVLKLIAQWRTNPEIARRLRYSEGSIKDHVRSILVKLRVKSRRHAAAKAVEIGLIPPPR